LKRPCPDARDGLTGISVKKCHATDIEEDLEVLLLHSDRSLVAVRTATNHGTACKLDLKRLVGGFASFLEAQHAGREELH
jgi:hypothetical protein